MESKTIYLVRHATPDRSRTDIPYRFPPGPPLSEMGLLEAERVAEFLQNRDLHRLFSSPFQRCQQTAELVARRTGAPITVLLTLSEMPPDEPNSSVSERMLTSLAIVIQEASRPIAVFSHADPISILLENMGADVDLLAALRIRYRPHVIPPAGVWLAVLTDAHWQLRQVFDPKQPRD